jgi:hypothetical protein
MDVHAMDLPSRTSETASEQFFRRVKKGAILFGIISLLLLEIFGCYYVTISTIGFGGGHLDTSRFSCNEPIGIGNLNVSICNKLVNLLKRSEGGGQNNTGNAVVGSISLNVSEWNTLSYLLR